MSTTQFTATFSQKELNAALTLVRKSAAVVTDTVRDGSVTKSWLEKNEHTYGYDHVAITVRDGRATFRTEDMSKNREGDTCRWAHINCTGHEGEGTFCVPIRVLQDYVKTFASDSRLALSYIGEVEKTERDGNYMARVEKKVTRHYLVITYGRNRANIVGKPASELMAWAQLVDAPAQIEEVKPIKTAYNMSDKTGRALAARKREEENVGAFCSIEARYTDMSCPVTFAPVADESDAIADATIAAITGEEYTAPAIAPAKPRVRVTLAQMRAIEQPAIVAPTPIRTPAQYTPAVGDTIFCIYHHEDGRTTDRVIDVQRVGNGVFRGYDRRYNRTRNFYAQHIAHCERWDEQSVYDHNGLEVVAAA